VYYHSAIVVICRHGLHRRTSSDPCPSSSSSSSFHCSILSINFSWRVDQHSSFQTCLAIDTSTTRRWLLSHNLLTDPSLTSVAPKSRSYCKRRGWQIIPVASAIHAQNQSSILLAISAFCFVNYLLLQDLLLEGWWWHELFLVSATYHLTWPFFLSCNRHSGPVHLRPLDWS